MDEQRIRLLFVIGQFIQGGAERYLYELCKALDKSKFHIEILTWKGISESDYYYPKLSDLGIPIYRKLPRLRYLARYVPFLYRKRRYRRLAESIHLMRSKIELGNFFDKYDLINIIQIENYYPMQHLFKDNKRLIIHLMSARYQYDHDPYEECLTHRKYKFVITDQSQKDDIRSSNLRYVETLEFPMVMDFSGREYLPNPSTASTPIKVGVFARLSPERPMEPFFYCFQSLLKDVDATLHIYGRGDHQSYYRTLDLLHIRDRVFFEGHRPDLKETLKKDNLSLVWLHSNGSFLGYASIEVASFGVPMVFWNMLTTPYEQILTQTKGAIHSFTNVSDFVAFNKGILLDPDKLARLGETLRAYVLSEYDVAKHIAILEVYFANLVCESKNR